MANLREAALQLTGALESLGIAYAIGGSFASSVHGVARPTQDLDIVAAISPAHVPGLVALLDKDFCWISGNEAIHLACGFRMKIFDADTDVLGRQQLNRREGAASFPVISAEDTILVKLRWYRDGGEASERQWNDIRNIVKVQSNLDLPYLTEWTSRLNVADLLSRVLAENAKRGEAPDDHA